MEVDFIKPFNFATASFAFKWAGKQNTSLFISHSLTSCNVNSLALCMSALVSRPEPLTSYLLNEVSISLTVLSLFLNWNLVGFAVRTFSRNRIVAYSENMKFQWVHCTLGWWRIDIDIRFIPIRAPKTKMIQMMMKASMAVRPSALGILLVMLLKMLTRHRKTVTRMVIRPGTLSGGTRKLIQDTMTNIPVGK